MDEVRIADADRDAASARVREAFAEGRLTESELETRLETIYKARTAADLSPAFQGLPRPPAPPEPVSRRASNSLAHILPAITPFLFVCVLVTVIWALTGADNFWPKWVYLGMGIAIFGRIAGMKSSQH
ncbi:MAG: DUF1707 SHOCT-like domain-containing protein [Acidimicrobiales bacterium]